MNRIVRKSLGIVAGAVSAATLAVLSGSAEGVTGLASTTSAGYIDPSATSAIVAAVSAGAVAIGAVVGVVWRNVKRRAAKVLHVNENAHKEVEEEFEINADENAAPAQGGVWDIEIPAESGATQDDGKNETATAPSATTVIAAAQKAPDVSMAGDVVVVKDPALPYEIHIHIHTDCPCRAQCCRNGEDTANDGKEN